MIFRYFMIFQGVSIFQITSNFNFEQILFCNPGNDVLFTFGEVDSSILILVNGWVTLSLGAHFEDRIQDNFEKQDTKSDFAPIRKSKERIRKTMRKLSGGSGAALMKTMKTLTGKMPGSEKIQVVRLRRRMNIESNFPPNFEGLVLGCIDADFSK